MSVAELHSLEATTSQRSNAGFQSSDTTEKPSGAKFQPEPEHQIKLESKLCLGIKSQKPWEATSFPDHSIFGHSSWTKHNQEIPRSSSIVASRAPVDTKSIKSAAINGRSQSSAFKPFPPADPHNFGGDWWKTEFERAFQRAKVTWVTTDHRPVLS